MAKKDAKEQLTRSLNTYIANIQDTLQLLNDEAPPSSLDIVPWDDVTTMGEQISKQATIAGMLWTGETPDLKELEECMSTYFTMLQGLLLLSNGSTIGAGPTLRSCIHASAKKIVDCSLSLLKVAVSSYGKSCSENRHLSIPQLTGTVWNACDALKKTPTTNYTAIGRAMTQVALSVKDVLREMKELKPASTDSGDETGDGVDCDASQESQSDQSSSGGDLGNNLSPEEMKIAELAVSFVSDTLVVIKEHIRLIASVVKRPDHSETRQSVKSLERLLELSKGIGAQADELGACLYPPQEISAIKAASDKMYSAVNEMKSEVLCYEECSSENFCRSCENCERSVRELQSNLSSDVMHLVSILENLEV